MEAVRLCALKHKLHRHHCLLFHISCIAIHIAHFYSSWKLRNVCGVCLLPCSNSHYLDQFFACLTVNKRCCPAVAWRTLEMSGDCLGLQDCNHESIGEGNDYMLPVMYSQVKSLCTLRLDRIEYRTKQRTPCFCCRGSSTIAMSSCGKRISFSAIENK